MRLTLTVTLLLASVFSAGAAVIDVTTGGFSLDVKGVLVDLEPLGADNVQIDAPFENPVTNPFAGELTRFNFANTTGAQFATGLYTVTLSLNPAPPSLGMITLTGPDTFEAVFNANLHAVFGYLSPGTCGSNCGDVLGEFGALPGFDDACEVLPTLPFSECDGTGPVMLRGNFAATAGGPVRLSNVVVSPAAIPEPSSVLLLVSGVAGLLLRRSIKR